MSDHFYHHLAVEAASGIAAASLVAPAIAIIDQSIIQNTAGTLPLTQGIKQGFTSLFKHPINFTRKPSFLLIWGVYSLTYITGNTIEATCKHFNRESFYPKFIGSSIANVSLSVSKDVVFTKMFGKGVAKPLPLPSYFLFGGRDTLTILAGFSLPPVIAQEICKSSGIDYQTCLVGSQLIIPCAMQFVSTPMHLLGLDLYNRPVASGRLAVVARDYFNTCWARVGRIFPAYGIGGVLNREIRRVFYSVYKI